MVYSLLYVSKTLLELPQDGAEVLKIVETSMVRNANLGVTGALVSTGTYFAQMLEGTQEAVEELMESIDADPRHMRVKTLRIAQEERRFAGWSMAYTGSAAFVDRHIAPFFSSLPKGDAAHLAQRLVSLIEEFARMPSM